MPDLIYTMAEDWSHASGNRF